jgi:molecular chaperone DnaK
MQRHLNYLSVGMDLGTSNSVVAVCDSRSNKIEVLECNDDPRNPKLLRSMVGYHNGGMRVVGIQARENLAETESGNTFFLTKRLLGRRYEEKIVQEVLEGKSFAKNASARPTKLNAQGGTRGGITEFKITSSGHEIKTVTSEQINAAIVSKMMCLVEEQYEGFSVAESRNIWQSPRTIVVISVPANYDAAQRKATRQAAEIAGIPSQNLTLINEPTAAAIHHRESYSTAPPEHLTLLVYDFGGGTLDVTIVQIGYNPGEWLGRCREAYVLLIFFFFFSTTLLTLTHSLTHALTHSHIHPITHTHTGIGLLIK